MKLPFLFTTLLLLVSSGNALPTKSFYPKTFHPNQVRLKEGPFKHAQDLNAEVLLQYDPDRFLAPYLKVAGLRPKAENYGNWESDGLDGHVGGHYLSAMAMHWVETGKPEFKDRMDSMLKALEACQEANGKKYPDWGVGYLGAVPGSDILWPEIKRGNVGKIWNYWVPWYNIHKMYAGLKDVWFYTGNATAQKLFLNFCDWAIDLTAGLSDVQMQEMLNSEHGGMNEVFADAYQMTGASKYLRAAKRFSHLRILTPMAQNKDNLDNLHANTQVPKAVGFMRIAEVAGNEQYLKASEFFWEQVAHHRSLSIGGNSRREHFPSAEACQDYIKSVEGPESCNTYNMLKLSEGLFRVDPRAEYADFYERAVFNHILSTQHPEHGGYVYFTPARPNHYRVYSAPNAAMWCCVGTGLENHGKYGQFIYSHDTDDLYLNLFIASELDWSEKNIRVVQETRFPESGESQLKMHMEAPTKFTLKVRHPEWVAKEAFEVWINGEKWALSSKPSSYASIDRVWEDGDSVQIHLPMQIAMKPLINVEQYYAFEVGPIVLGARTGTEDLEGLIADDHRWAHIAHGPKRPLNEAPIIIEDQINEIPAKLKPIQNKPQHFAMDAVNMLNAEDRGLVLEPFYQIHDARYMMYWWTLTPGAYQQTLEAVARNEAELIDLDRRTVDQVLPGQQQPESDHFMQVENSQTGVQNDEFWRDARDGGFFSYQLKTNGQTDLALRLRYWGTNWQYRTFDIIVDDQVIATENILKWNIMEFKEETYSIPEALLEGKEHIRVKFQAPEKGIAGGIFHVRLFTPKPGELPQD